MMLATERRARLAAFKKECVELESQIKELKAQVRQANSRIEQKKCEMAPLAPVYTLADDVAAEILKFAYQHHFPHCRLDDGLPHTNSPIAISHVSRWWRRQATLLPLIWTCIHVTPEQPAHYAKVVKAYLVRSRGLPLSISFQCFSRDTETEDEDLAPQIDWRRFKASWKYLLTEKGRWKNCSIYLWHEQSARIILSSLNSYKFPRLEYLGISIGAEDQCPFVLPQFEAPNLTELRTELWFPVARAPLGLFNRLIDLKIHGIHCTVGKLMNVLVEAAGTLRRFSLSQASLGIDDNPTNIPSQTLSRLTYLSLHDVHEHHDHEDRKIFSMICRAAVALDTLSAPQAMFAEALCSGTISLPTLRHLFLSHSWSLRNMRNLEIRALLSSTANLQTLQALGARHIRRWLDAAVEMDKSSGGCIAWPILESLTLNDIECGAALSMFVHHRVRIEKPLKNLAFGDELAGSLSSGVLDSFQQLRVDLSTYSRASAEAQALLRSPNDWWNNDVDKPNFIPWKGSHTFYDQFDPPKH